MQLAQGHTGSTVEPGLKSMSDVTVSVLVMIVL